MSTRREFIKKAGYAAPVVLTMAAKPSFASSGSGQDETKPSSKKRGKSRGKKKGKAKKKSHGRSGNNEAGW